MCAAQARPREAPWYDQALLTDSSGVVLPGVGAMAPGYVLVCPAPHVLSLAQVPPDLRAGFARLCHDAIKRIEASFGPSVVFEHGACDGGQPRSQCVAHAHLHVWAVAEMAPLDLPATSTRYSSLEAFLVDGERWSDQTYVMCSDAQGLVVNDDPAVPQFFRRRIATALGRDDEWDYATNWFETNMRATIEAFQRK